MCLYGIKYQAKLGMGQQKNAKEYFYNKKIKKILKIQQENVSIILVYIL